MSGFAFDGSAVASLDGTTVVYLHPQCGALLSRIVAVQTLSMCQCCVVVAMMNGLSCYRHFVLCRRFVLCHRNISSLRLRHYPPRPTAVPLRHCRREVIAHGILVTVLVCWI